MRLSKNLKKSFHWLHLVIGLVSGSIIFIIALSGSCYAFEKEIRSVIHRDLYQSTEHGGRTISADSVIKIIALQYPKEKIRAILFHSAEKNIQVDLKSKTSVFIAPQTGKVLGEIDMEKEVLAVILKIHRELCLGETGKKITGTSAILFTLSLLSGLVLWWPNNKKSLKHRLQLTSKKGNKRLLFDSHSTIGFYASWILIITALTGLVFSFKWVEKAMFSITGNEKKEWKIKSTPTVLSQKTNLEELVRHVEANYPEKNIHLVFPQDSSGTFRFTIQVGQKGMLTQNDHLYFDQYTGVLRAHRYYAEQNMGEKLRASNLNLHTGKVLGLTGEILVFIAGLAAASLPITGFLMWRNKQKSKKQ